MSSFSLFDQCVMLPFNHVVRERCLPFSCGDTDLDDFFHNDSERYAEELMGKTYCWITEQKPHRIVALFTLANDSIKTGCRFLVVDAYNNPRTLHFYEQNNFSFLHADEAEECAYYNIPTEEAIATRLMYFDLKKP